jgi:hypothetical protein
MEARDPTFGCYVIHRQRGLLQVVACTRRHDGSRLLELVRPGNLWNLRAERFEVELPAGQFISFRECLAVPPPVEPFAPVVS